MTSSLRIYLPSELYGFLIRPAYCWTSSVNQSGSISGMLVVRLEHFWCNQIQSLTLSLIVSLACIIFFVSEVLCTTVFAYSKEHVACSKLSFLHLSIHVCSYYCVYFVCYKL